MSQDTKDYSKTENDLLYGQVSGELRGQLKLLNEKYKGFFHFKLLTMVNLLDESCQTCVDEHQTCSRAVIGFEQPMRELGNIFRRIKSKVNLASLFWDGDIPMKFEDGSFVGKCPFCKEEGKFKTTANFELWYCFGCHLTGDVISYIERMHNCTPMEAANILGKRFLPHDPQFNPTEESEKEKA